MKVFDWDRAAHLIRERSPDIVSAGLSGDLEYTEGDIYRDGKPVPRDNTYTYLASTWATPLLIIDGDEVECFRMESETAGWDAGTYWPESALAILNDGA